MAAASAAACTCITHVHVYCSAAQTKTCLVSISQLVLKRLNVAASAKPEGHRQCHQQRPAILDQPDCSLAKTSSTCPCCFYTNLRCVPELQCSMQARARSLHRPSSDHHPLQQQVVQTLMQRAQDASLTSHLLFHVCAFCCRAQALR